MDCALSAWARRSSPCGCPPSIVWTANYRDGRVKRFKLPIRTTPWGSIEPYPDDARPDSLDRKSTSLFGESKYLGVDRRPTPGAA
jgi:adenylylsulfate reductase subunit B